MDWLFVMSCCFACRMLFMIVGLRDAIHSASLVGDVSARRGAGSSGKMSLSRARQSGFLESKSDMMNR